jgi:hypothetical protein
MVTPRSAWGESMRPLLALTLVLLVAGCSRQKAAPAASEATDIGETARFAGYPMDHLGAGTIQLSAGAYHDSAAGLDVKLIATATGDLDGDDRKDAAVVLASNTGGTGTFIDLFALVDGGDRTLTRGPASLGDRVKVDSIRVSDRAIHLHLLTQGPNDPLCCPTQHVVETFVLHADTLMRRPAEQP